MTKAKANVFEGFTPDTFRFFLEIGFNNDRAFMDANRERYREVLQLPLKMLANELIPVALDMNPGFNTKMTTLVSRINRDTRFSKNKLPYRDHAWIGFRNADEATSESFCVYFELEPNGYGYGMGMYGANAELMRPFRERAAADPQRLADLSRELTSRGFTIQGEEYKKDRFPALPESVKPFVNRKGISWCYFSKDIEKAFSRALLDEVSAAFRLMTPLYKYVTGE